MVAQGKWIDVTICFVSKFAPTLTENTIGGSDHAWGGHYFYVGGSIKGGKMFGSYPPDLSPEGPSVFQPGVVIPGFAWQVCLVIPFSFLHSRQGYLKVDFHDRDGFWNGIAQWFGLTETSELDDYCRKGTLSLTTSSEVQIC